MMKMMTGKKLYEQAVVRIQAVRQTEGKEPLAWLVPWLELLRGERDEYVRLARIGTDQELTAWDLAVELTMPRVELSARGDMVRKIQGALDGGLTS